MEMFIDSADPNEIRRYRKLGLAQGVTTNPGSFGAVGQSSNPVDLLRAILDAADGIPVFLQVRACEPLAQVEEAKRLSAMGSAIVIKVIMDEVGFQSIPLMVKAGLQVSATAVNSVGRAILAAKCGAHYMIPYYGWLEDTHDRSTNLIKDVGEIYQAQRYQTRIHVYCRRMADVIVAAKAGAWGVLLQPQDLQRFFDHPHTAVAVDGHRASWDARYRQGTTWLDFLVEPAVVGARDRAGLDKDR
jgi:TalC/MipB family fructose-6-phosphate aldolase